MKKQDPDNLNDIDSSSDSDDEKIGQRPTNDEK